MRFKIILFLFIKLISYDSLKSQSTNEQLDSILNAYDRQFRTELNDSDFKLITKQIGQIGSSCEKLEAVLESNLYTSNYKIALLNNFSDFKRCPKTILDFIDLFEVSDQLGTDYNLGININYPEFKIYHKIVDDREYFNYFSKFLINSKYLDDCSFLVLNKHSIFKLKMLSNLAREGNNSDFKKSPCLLANLIILENI